MSTTTSEVQVVVCDEPRCNRGQMIVQNDRVKPQEERSMVLADEAERSWWTVHQVGQEASSSLEDLDFCSKYCIAQYLLTTIRIVVRRGGVASEEGLDDLFYEDC